MFHYIGQKKYGFNWKWNDVQVTLDVDVDDRDTIKLWWIDRVNQSLAWRLWFHTMIKLTLLDIIRLFSIHDFVDDRAHDSLFLSQVIYRPIKC